MTNGIGLLLRIDIRAGVRTLEMDGGLFPIYTEI